ncbi:hypothetical protein CPC735_038670 [Coccidioides posadasii C735 delta SOWgp]|uniref:F-box domain-containing protein n=1 Tax=Coccidioides posadasii (strain C735) TaxID=222929 RepID=C5P2R5_COCP7|nr:hypothetical protein CPC735_038670 [Coccidioides posadasii C735 delta SOWgp]EER28603.1 hypothetical protein CPC735_038670 [Coccidioides posadasii C735 delta SOWgp]|eukprot:XP_003070748.1 hypothetical protein CPC735_038670 [Coccidioides posadasii C735 delta SOWgp]
MIAGLATEQRKAPSASVSAFFETKSKKFFAAIEKATGYYAKATHGHPGAPNGHQQVTHTSSHWDKLPVELQLSIFCQCRLRDIQCLRLVCRSFCDLVDANEHAIARDYLRIRRHGSLPSLTHRRITHSRAPQDDVILLSDLFPPPGAIGDLRDAYTFRYLASLRRRQEICSKLSYYLADRILDRYTQSHPAIKASFASKRDRQACYERGVARLQFKLTPLMFYVLYFLEVYSQSKSDQLDHMYSLLATGYQDVPLTRAHRIDGEHISQCHIIRSPPFEDPGVLISTHHVFFVLASYLLDAVAPDYPFNSNGDTLASMLLTIGLERIVEFFAAEKGGGYNQRTLRRTFMRNMQRDWDAYTKSDKVIGVYGGDERNHDPVPLDHIWHSPALEMLRRKGRIPHQSQDWVIVWEGVKIYLHCQHCEGMRDGWAAAGGL